VTASAAACIEIRWREVGTEQWSDPIRRNPAGEVVIPRPDRDKEYEAEVRAVSSCGAPSLWVSASDTVPGAPAGTLTLKGVQQEAEDAADAAFVALAELDDIADDGKLTAKEKVQAKPLYDTIIADQAGIDAQATAFLLTAEQTTYDNAITALKTYLKDTVGVLNSSYVWTGITGTTAITRSTWDSKWKDVYTAKTALLNAIYAEARKGIETAFGTNTVVNAGAETGRLAPHYTQGGNWIVSASRPDTGIYSFYLSRAGRAPGSAYLYANWDGTSRVPAAREGEVWMASVRAADLGSGAGDNVSPRILFRDAAGTLLTPTAQSIGSVVSNTDYATAVTYATAPAGTVLAHLRVDVDDAGVSTGTFIDNLELRKATVADKASGVQLGDMRNQAVVTTANVAAAWSGLTFSWTASSTSASISTSACNLISGALSIPYSAAGPAVISGTAGTSKRVYIYCVDPTYSGGAKSIIATTTYINTINGDGKVLMGDVLVAFPASGTSTGTGRGRCVSIESWVRTTRGRIRAGDVRVGDEVVGPEGARPVECSVRYRVPGVRLVDVDGHSYTCSATAEWRGRDGESVFAAQALGRVIETEHGMKAVAEVHALGLIDVQAITAGNGWYYAGDERLAVHHNIKNDVPDP
jgi:hypothetical protein